MRDRTIESLHPRVAATFALIPLTFGVVIGAYLLLSEYWVSAGGWILLLGVVLGPAFVFYGGSLLIWWPTVRWTRRKLIGTLVTTLLYVLSIAAVGVPFGVLSGNPMSFVWMLVASLLFGPVALVTLSWICWTPLAEREAAGCVPCPKCGFDLRGQQECRCPECGFVFQVGQIAPMTRTQETLA
ncbi:MAG: hypothetical protein ACKVS9_15495 [Phycisphaerae bacterium]